MKAGTKALLLGLALLALILIYAVKLMDPPPGKPLPGQRTTVTITTR